MTPIAYLRLRQGFYSNRLVFDLNSYYCLFDFMDCPPSSSNMSSLA